LDFLHDLAAFPGLFISFFYMGFGLGLIHGDDDLVATEANSHLLADPEIGFFEVNASKAQLRIYFSFRAYSAFCSDGQMFFLKGLWLFLQKSW